jgi:hypothetical protein
MEEEEDDQDTSIKGRLLALVYKIKGQPLKTEEEPTEQEQQAPCKTIPLILLLFYMSQPAITGTGDSETHLVPLVPVVPEGNTVPQ